MPADQGIRFHIPQSIAPGEHPAQGCHYPARGIAGRSWLDLPLLKQCQLLTEEQVLSRQSAARPHAKSDETTQIEDHDRRSDEAVPESGDQNQRSAYERSGSHVTISYTVLPHAAEEVLADNNLRVVREGHGPPRADSRSPVAADSSSPPSR